MIEFKTPEEIEKIKKSGRILQQTLALLRENVRAEITTSELSSLAEEFIISAGAIPAIKGYGGFPAAVCISVNDEVVHGIPGTRKLKKGDLVSFDSAVLLDGWYADSAITVVVEKEKSDEDKKLIEITKKALYIGIAQARIGNKVNDISLAVQQYVENNNFSVVRDYTGHGIGKHLHEDPSVPNFVIRNNGIELREGLCIAIEPMVCKGGFEVCTGKDGWTVKTADHSNAAHFEHTIVVTKNGPEILTL
ncbi:MAG: type I methionyl aminopeptidase [Caldisericota bacterium]|nr:type I methionyl aminopeptidase [Caldisericota bacterium]